MLLKNVRWCYCYGCVIDFIDQLINIKNNEVFVITQINDVVEELGWQVVATKIKTEESFGWWTKTGHLHVQYCVNDMSAKEFYQEIKRSK